MKKLSKLFNQKAVLIALVVLAFGFQSCSETPKEKEPTVTEFNLSSAKTEIENVNKDFMNLIAKGDSAGVANLYTTDAELMFSGAPAYVGRADIQTAIAGVINSGVTKIELKTKEVFGTEDLLAEEGEVNIYVKENVVANEKYIVLWKKKDGKWKLFRDITNSNTPEK